MCQNVQKLVGAMPKKFNWNSFFSYFLCIKIYITRSQSYSFGLGQSVLWCSRLITHNHSKLLCITIIFHVGLYTVMLD